MFHKYMFQKCEKYNYIIGKSYIKNNKHIETDTNIIENNKFTILNHIKSPKEKKDIDKKCKCV